MADNKNNSKNKEEEIKLLKEEIKLLKERNKLNKESEDSFESIINKMQRNNEIIKRNKFEEAKLKSKINDTDLQHIKNIEGAEKNLNNIQKKLEEELAKSKRLQNKTEIESLEKQITNKKKFIQTTTNAVSLDARNLMTLKKQTSALEGQNASMKGIVTGSKGFGNALKGAVGESKLLSGLTSKIAPNLMKGGAALNPYVLAATIIVELINQLIEAFKFLDSSSGELAKNFGTSYDEAAKLNSELVQTAASSGNIYATTKNLQEAYTDINNTFGTFARLNDKTLLTYTELTKQIGLSKEASLALFKSSLFTTKSLEKTTKEFMGQAKLMSVQKGLALNQKQLQESIAKISSATTLSLKANPKELAKAVVNAKALGVELDQVEKIANSLLQFESSIENEMAAELLTGKQINLERARLASLNGDIATVAEEIAKQVGTAAQFGKMNVIQQEALAKGVGMEREELAKALIEREALQKIGVKDAADAKKKFDLLVKEKGYAAAVKELGDEQYAKQLQSASVQERFNQLIEKGRELFVQMVEPFMQFVGPLMEIATVYFSEIFKMVNSMMEPFREMGKEMGILKEGSGGFMDILKDTAVILSKYIFLPLTAIGKYMTTIMSEQLKGIFKYFKGIGDVVSGFLSGDWNKVGDGLKNMALGIIRLLLSPIQAVINGVTSLINGITGGINVVTKYLGIGKIPEIPKFNIANQIDQVVGDGVAPSSKGPFTITDKYGATAVTSQGDNLAVSPNMSKGNNVPSAGMVEELKAIKQILSQILSKEGTINFDGNKVGQALSLASYKTQ